MLRAWGRRGVCLKSSGALDECCRCSNEEVWRYGGMEASCRHAAVDASKIWSSGALEVRCRRRDVEVWRHEALEL